MTLLRALSIPFHFTSAVFVTLLSLLLAFAVSYDTTRFLWLIPAIIMTSWTFKYAFAMLESIADGETHAPVASYEMLGVFEQRPLVLMLLMLAIGQFTLWVHGVTGYLLVAMLLALLPAFIGILGATRRVLSSLNPVVLTQTVRGMGWWYLLLLFAIAVNVTLTAWLVRSGVWRIVVIWQIAMSVLIIFSLIGGVIYERRIEIGYEPRHSPERVAVHDQREHHRQLKHTLDEVYTAVRLGDLVRGMTQLEQWLSGADDDFVALDCQHIHSTIADWNDKEMLISASRSIVVKLVNARHPEMLAAIIVSTLRALPAFTLKSENSLLLVVHGLQSAGRHDLAQTLVKNFVNNFPAQVTPGVSALMQRLNPVKQ